MSEEVYEIYEDTKRQLFKSGIVVSTETVRDFILGILVVFFAFTWPWQLFDYYVINKVKKHIKRH